MDPCMCSYHDCFLFIVSVLAFFCAHVWFFDSTNASDSVADAKFFDILCRWFLSEFVACGIRVIVVSNARCLISFMISVSSEASAACSRQSWIIFVERWH
uniref:Uncharacterized protein n=1 Tax=Arundo donax TaxID=35708 RepID=A0A0A9D7T7_ARUDO